MIPLENTQLELRSAYQLLDKNSKDDFSCHMEAKNTKQGSIFCLEINERQTAH